MNDTKDNLAPPGMRLLVQLLDAAGPTQARFDLMMMFGWRRAMAATLIPGTRTPGQRMSPKQNHVVYEAKTPWRLNGPGFRAYLPIGFR